MTLIFFQMGDKLYNLIFKICKIWGHQWEKKVVPSGGGGGGGGVGEGKQP